MESRVRMSHLRLPGAWVATATPLPKTKMYYILKENAKAEKTLKKVYSEQFLAKNEMTF